MTITRTDLDRLSPLERDALDRVLDRSELCSVGSTSPWRGAHINTAYFARLDAADLVILTAPRSEHGVNLTADPRSAVAIYETGQVWGRPHLGLQMFGTCEEMVGHEHERGFDRYVQRFPRLVELAPTAGAVLDDLESRFFRFRPLRIKLLDEEAFGEEHWIDIACTTTEGAIS